MDKYTLKMWGLCVGAAFLTLFSLFIMLRVLSSNFAVSGVITGAIFLVAMFMIGQYISMPQDALKRYFPFFLPIVFISIAMLVQLLMNWTPFPLDNSGFIENIVLYIATAAVCIVTAACFAFGAQFAGKPKAMGWKRFWLLPCTVMAIGFPNFGLDAYHASHALRAGGRAERVTEEISLVDYAPFSENNRLVQVDFAPSLTINDKYPRLDGATAAYPVYATVAETIYRGLDAETVKNYVECNRTDGAFERLISGDADIIFGVQPSREQLASAKEAGVTLISIRVSREAFVFFVNTENPIRDLSVEQIQKIYTKEITDWSEVGGKRGGIIPYQRAENSGSQTIMENVVMRGIAMAPPLHEESAALMGGMLGDVASYSGAIGYSFRYYATAMNPNERPTLLSVNGIEPTIENIRTGVYPFAVDVYAYTTESALNNQNVQKLVDWMVSEEGQRLIELCGYVSVV